MRAKAGYVDEGYTARRIVNPLLLSATRGWAEIRRTHEEGTGDAKLEMGVRHGAQRLKCPGDWRNEVNVSGYALSTHRIRSESGSRDKIQFYEFTCVRA